MKKQIVCAGSLVFFLIVSVSVAMLWKSKAVAEEHRLSVAQAFLETLYTADAVRYQNHQRETNDGAHDSWNVYYSDYMELATDSCLSAMRHFLFTMVDKFEAECGKRTLIKGIEITPIAGADTGVLWKYYYSVNFCVVSQEGDQSESYCGQGMLYILHREGGEPKVHSVEISDINLFNYILAREK